MSEIDQILGQVPIDEIASRLGVSREEAENATRAALPALLGGLQANAADPGGALSLAGALQDRDESALDGGLDSVDTDDGHKIVANIFGGNTDAVASRLASAAPLGSGASPGLVERLLPMLAPIVMAYVARRLATSGGLGSIIGSVLGGASGGGGGLGGGAASGGLGDLLGQILGSGAPGSGSAGGLGGGLGDILGGLLGGLLGGGKKA